MLRTVNLLMLSLLVLLAGCNQTPAPGLDSEQPLVTLSAQGRQAPFVEGEVIVKFRSDMSAQSLNALSVPGVGLNRLRALGEGGDVTQLYRTAVKDRVATLKLIETLNVRPDVLYAHPNYLVESFATPNDPL